MSLRPLWHDARLRRRALIGLYGALLALVLAGMTVITAALLLSPQPHLQTQLAEVADFLSGGTAALALIAGLVALQAYATATGLPDLEVQIWFNFSSTNCPVFTVDEVEDGVLQTTAPFEQTTAMVALRNRSLYSAKNPAVTVRLKAVVSDIRWVTADSDGWAIFEFPDDSVNDRRTAMIEWDGGGSCLIHGRAARRLPDLKLGILSHNLTWGTPLMLVEILADGGYRRDLEVAIKFEKSGSDSADRVSRPEGSPTWL